MPDEESYDGIAVPDLRIDLVEWTAEQAEHIRTRSSRYAGAFDIEPEWATEASLIRPGGSVWTLEARQVKASALSAAHRPRAGC